MTTVTAPKQDLQTLVAKIQRLPTDRIEQVADFVDFLRERARLGRDETDRSGLRDFPVDDLGPWPRGLSLHREDLYTDGGR